MQLIHIKNQIITPRKIMMKKILLLLLFTSISINPNPGDKAPDGFMIMDYTTKSPAFFDTFIGDKNVLLNFWATYCEPCKKEIPEIIKKFSKNPKIRIYFVNVDEESEMGLVEQKIAEFGIASNSLLDTNKVAAAEYIKPKLSVPANIIINKKGILVYEAIGYKEDTISKITKIISGLP